jgi:AcrR family transcriptional regulator
MVRTQASDFEMRREVIAAAAAPLFARQGFLGTTVADISAGSNISKSLMYHYFPSKEDILFEVMWGHVSVLVEFGRQVAGFQRPAAEMVRWFARGLMETYVGARDAQKILLNELDHLPPEKRALVVEAQREVVSVVDGLLVALRPGLRNRPRERTPIVMMFFGMLNWTHVWFDPKGPVSAVKVAELAANMFLDGLPRGKGAEW